MKFLGEAERKNEEKRERSICRHKNVERNQQIVVIMYIYCTGRPTAHQTIHFKRITMRVRIAKRERNPILSILHCTNLSISTSLLFFIVIIVYFFHHYCHCVMCVCVCVGII